MSKGHPHQMFSKVHAARKLLLERAEEIITEYLEVARLAKEDGQYEEAYKALQWLIEHMPSDAGERMVESSVDKKQEVVEKDTRPAIQIGISLGGITKKKELPEASVIDGEISSGSDTTPTALPTQPAK